MHLREGGGASAADGHGGCPKTRLIFGGELAGSLSTGKNWLGPGLLPPAEQFLFTLPKGFSRRAKTVQY